MRKRKTTEQKAASKRRRTNARWKLIERVVAVLESLLHGAAKVERGVWLPELVSKKERQFDVTIRFGPSERPTLTVVEVQDRGVKLGYEKLGALFEKAMAVGASHLICVSTAGFVTDAITRAKTYGPKVRLLTLNEMEQGAWPLNFATGHLFIYAYDNGHFDMIAELDPADRAAFEAMQGNLRPRDIDEKVFERNGAGPLLSARDLHGEATKRYKIGIPVALKSQENAVFKYIPGPGEKLYIVRNSARARVQLIDLKTRIDVEVIPVPISTFEYRPVEGASSLLWAAVGRGTLEGEAFAIQFTYDEQRDGRLAIRAISLLEGSDKLKGSLEIVLRPLSPKGVDRLQSLVSQSIDPKSN